MVAMDASRDALFVGDSAGYIHVLRLALCAKGALQPLVQLERIPPAGEALAVCCPHGESQYKCTSRLESAVYSGRGMRNSALVDPSMML